MNIYYIKNQFVAEEANVELQDFLSKKGLGEDSLFSEEYFFIHAWQCIIHLHCFHVKQHYNNIHNLKLGKMYNELYILFQELKVCDRV